MLNEITISNVKKNVAVTKTSTVVEQDNSSGGSSQGSTKVVEQDNSSGGSSQDSTKDTTIHEDCLAFRTDEGASDHDVTITLKKTGEPDKVYFEYILLTKDSYSENKSHLSSLGDVTWNPFDDEHNEITVPSGSLVFVQRAASKDGSSGNTQTKTASNNDNYYYFSFSDTIGAQGSIMYLLDKRFTSGSYKNSLANAGEYTFANLFKDSKLTTAPTLPATTLKDSCYSNMFNGCTSLSAAPVLPAESLANSCYAYMFNRCTSIVNAPTLPATTLKDSCYSNMFNGCTSLNNIKVNFTSWDSVTSPTENWLNNVSATGTFTYPEGLDISVQDASHVPSGWTQSKQIKEPIPNDCLAFRTDNGSENHDVTISLVNSENPETVSLEYTILTKDKYNSNKANLSSLGDVTWYPFDNINNTSFVVPANSIAFVQRHTSKDGSDGNAQTSFAINSPVDESKNYIHFSFSDTIGAQGSIMYLLDKRFTDSGNNEYYNSLANAGKNTFRRLFTNSKLTTAPDLPATVLKDNCYDNLFRECASLINAPAALPATTLATYCYSNMFSGCTKLTTAPTFSAQTVAKYCCANMFQGCTSLTIAPSALPATTLATYCYNYMFDGCTSLTTAPTISATTLADYCCAYMFNGCTSLTVVPSKLPAKTLKPYCYSNMFSGCTKLTTTPILPAITLEEGCYNELFCNCTSLKKVEVRFSRFVEGTTKDWLKNISNTGDFICGGDMRIYKDTTIGNASYIPSNFSIKQVNDGPIPNDCLAFRTDEGTEDHDVKVTLNTTSYLEAPVISLQYTLLTKSDYNNHKEDLSKLGDVSWYVFDTYSDDDRRSINNANYFTVPSGYIAFVQRNTAQRTGYDEKGDPQEEKNSSPNEAQTTFALKGSENYYYNYFSFTDTIGAQGSVMYLLDNRFTDENNPDYYNNLTKAYNNGHTFYNLFANSELTTAPDLPATTLKPYCYSNMFSGCTKLTTAPTISATTLAEDCYNYMFDGCTSLTEAPDLPATTLARCCYERMFKGCTSLVTAPELPATNLAELCYRSMFNGCTNLTTAPDLPATTLSGSCYQYMFNGCTSLTTAPELPATELANNCYKYMFNGCTSLNNVIVKFTSWDGFTTPTTDWLKGVSSTGTFICPQSLDISTKDASHVPNGWVVNHPLTSLPAPTFDIPEIKAYVLDECIDMGNVSIEEYDDAHMIIEAIPLEGYKFVSWNDNNTDNPRIIEKDAELYDYYASFEEVGLEEDNPETIPNNENIDDLDNENIANPNIENIDNPSNEGIETLFLPFLNNKNLFGNRKSFLY